MSDGFFTLPCRVVLPAEQRDRLERLCRARSMEVSDLVSELVVQYLDEVPDSALAEPIPEPYAPSLSEQLRQNERELRRLLMRQNQLGASAPGWLDNYVADVEREIAVLRRKLEG